LTFHSIIFLKLSSTHNFLKSLSFFAFSLKVILISIACLKQNNAFSLSSLLEKIQARLYHALAFSGSSLIAFSLALSASSYRPSSLSATPLLFHALAFSGSSSIAFSLALSASSYRPSLPSATTLLIHVLAFSGSSSIAFS